jgi:hypothetical protein
MPDLLLLTFLLVSLDNRALLGREPRQKIGIFLQEILPLRRFHNLSSSDDRLPIRGEACDTLAPLEQKTLRSVNLLLAFIPAFENVYAVDFTILFRKDNA